MLTRVPATAPDLKSQFTGNVIVADLLAKEASFGDENRKTLEIIQTSATRRENYADKKIAGQLLMWRNCIT